MVFRRWRDIRRDPVVRTLEFECLGRRWKAEVLPPELARPGESPEEAWFVSNDANAEHFIGPRFRGEGATESRRRLISAALQFAQRQARDHEAKRSGK